MERCEAVPISDVRVDPASKQHLHFFLIAGQHCVEHLLRGWECDVAAAWRLVLDVIDAESKRV